MATTKYKISEQVMMILNGGDPGIASAIDIRDVMEMVGQMINRRLKAEYYGPHIKGGEVNAGNLMLATYEGIEVNNSGKYAKITLPCMPIRLLKNQGLYEISPDGDELAELQFIPVPAGMWFMNKAMSITSDLLGQVCYFNEGLNVIFTRDIKKIDEVDKVRVKLVVSDVSVLGEYDPLPVPADMEADIITDILQVYGFQRPADKVVDISTEPTKQ